MATQVKLSPKRLEVMKNLQAQKAQLNQAMQQLQDKEGIIVSLVMEDNEITNVKSVKLEEDCLIFEENEAPDPKSKKADKKVVKMPQTDQ